MANEKRLVWDLPLRLFHWLFAISIFASWYTAEVDEMEIHFWLGYFMIGLVLFRLVWGFIGPRHARFSSFLKRPPAIWLYLKSIGGREHPQSIGHNPLGGLMVIAMLILVAAQTATGLFATDDIIWAGPYNPAVSGETAEGLTAFHHYNFNVILGAIVLHLVAVAFYAFAKRHYLVPPMLHGRKLATIVPEHEAIASSQVLKALVVAAVSAAAVWWLVNTAPPPPESVF
jgi:cytochrome b